MGSMIKTTHEICMKCKYHYGGNSNGTPICDYLAKTGNRRNCDVGKCDKFEEGKVKEEWEEMLIE